MSRGNCKMGMADALGTARLVFAVRGMQERVGPPGPLGTAVFGGGGGQQPVVGQGRRKRPRRISGRGHDVREPPAGRRGGGFRLLQPLVRKPAGQQGRSPASSRQRWELSLRAL